MLRMLLGRRSAEELRGADLAALVFESPNDLSWLIERCLGSGGKESTETTWRRKDGSRLLVRLSARATSPDLIECGVEDLTPIRVLNDRLSEAHRMEAVGRLATEVAVTCGNLLGGVQQNAQQWLMTDGSNVASRHHGEMLLEEISRAAGLLRQFAAYGDEESRSPAAVELRTVVRDVAPVLKRIAGDGVEVQLPAAVRSTERRRRGRTREATPREPRCLCTRTHAAWRAAEDRARHDRRGPALRVQASQRPPWSPRSCDGDGKPARDPNRRTSAPSRARSRVELARRSDPDAGRSRRTAGAHRTLRRPPVDDRRTCRGHDRQDQVAAGDRIWRATATTSLRRVPTLARWFQH